VIDVDTGTQALLDRYGFDANLFESLRAKVASGELSPESNVIRGDIEPPAAEDVTRLPEATDPGHEEARDAGVEALARVMAADLEGSPVTLNILLPGGATETGMIPEDVPDELRSGLLDADVMGPPIVWLASPAAAGVHAERIVATEFTT